MSADTTLAAIRERAEADYVTDPNTVTSDLAKDLMQARIDRQALLDLIDRPEEVP